MTDPHGYSVLVVEDNADHRLLVSIAFQKVDPLVTLHQTTCADEAVAYLMGLRKDLAVGKNVALPMVIVLDINMPGISGLGFLKWAAKQPDWIRHTPVIAFSSSDDQSLALTCLELGAREYLEKPQDFLELVELAQRIGAERISTFSQKSHSRPLDPRSLRVWNLASNLGYAPGSIDRLIVEFGGNESAIQTVIEWAFASRLSLDMAADEISVWDASLGVRRFIEPDRHS